MLVKFLTRLWDTQKALCIVWAGAVIYTFIFSIISFIRYDAFSYSDFDFAIFTHECWKILHGSANISIFNNTPIWGNGLELISFVISPIFFIFNNNPKSLLFLQAFALGASAVPIFLIARRKLPQQLAVCLSISYLLNPSVWYANLYEYNPLVYATFTLLMAFHFFEEKRFKVFMVFIILTLLNRADLCVVTFMFGAYAFFSKRSWHWVLVPSLLSVFWMILGLLVIIPQFKGSLSYDSNYAQFGNGFSEIIKNMFLHPKILWQSLVTKENGKYFIQILFPVNFLSLLGIKEFLICSISLLQHLVSSRHQEHTINFHYTSTITPFVYISAAYGMARLALNRRVVVLMGALLISFSVFANCRYGPISYYRYYLAQLHTNDENEYNREFLKRIPDNAGVASTFAFSPMLAGRESYYSFHYIYLGLFNQKVVYQTPKDIDYALINFIDSRLMSFETPGADIRVREFLNKDHFGVVDMANSVVLFKKGYQGPLKLYEILSPPQAQKRSGSSVQVSNLIKLVGLNVHKEIKNNTFFLDFVFYWKAIAHVDKDIVAEMMIIDEHGKLVYRTKRILCYGIYPSSRWSLENEVAEYYDMFLPGALAIGRYKVYMALYPKYSYEAYPLTKIEGDKLSGQVPFKALLTTEFSIK